MRSRQFCVAAVLICLSSARADEEASPVISRFDLNVKSPSFGVVTIWLDAGEYSPSTSPSVGLFVYDNRKNPRKSLDSISLQITVHKEEGASSTLIFQNKRTLLVTSCNAKEIAFRDYTRDLTVTRVVRLNGDERFWIGSCRNVLSDDKGESPQLKHGVYTIEVVAQVEGEEVRFERLRFAFAKSPYLPLPK